MEILPFINVKYDNLKGWQYDPTFVIDDFETVKRIAIESLTKRLECELRAAKRTHLECGEVMLPRGFLQTVVNEIYEMAESEPYGLRGCTLHLSFENDQMCRKLSTIKCDSDTVSTFELYLTLRQDLTGWKSLIPQFIKNLTRGSGTVVISPQFTLDKKQLYRSNESN